MVHTYYSLRTGKNKNTVGFDLPEFKKLFLRRYKDFEEQGYFDEYLGSQCVDIGIVPGKVRDIELEILLKIRKQDLWPIDEKIDSYLEDDLFDIIEFLFLNVSKPIDGTYHNYADCGMHWESFNRIVGQNEFVFKVNELMALYKEPYVLSNEGEILHQPELGFDKLLEADVPSNDASIKSRIDSAILRYRRHASTLDDRRQAVRDLADVLEYLRPKVKSLLTKNDEKDLFNLANNFGIRHHNPEQKTNYDAALWLSWMFYYYLATIHVLLRKMDQENI